MKKVVFLIFLFNQSLFAQTIDKITLDECYQLAQEAFPLNKQKDLIRQINVLNINTLQKNLLPQIELNAQATYQSDVTQFPVKLPNVDVPPLSKDQYKVAFDVKQIIWDGGVINLQKNVLKSQADVETQKVEVESAKLKERINQLYFSILQIDENAKLIDLLKSDISARLKKIEGGIANGTALKMNAQVLEAENLKADQRLIELYSLRSASISMLNELIKKELTDKTVFEKPKTDTPLQRSPNGQYEIGLKINRPELKLYDLQKTQIDQTVKVVSLRNFPRIYAFATAGYGRPGLNFLKNEFVLYGIGGVTFKWNISDYYTKTLKNDLDILRINQQAIDIQRDVFLTNTQIQIKQQSAEITKWEQLLEKDAQIVDLRTKIKATSGVQLENGIMTANDYIIELNAESQARQNLILHQLQLLNAKINLKTITNN
jgi:outer membrane protein TolC